MDSNDIYSRYHYTYRITNLVECKHYYGSRSSKVHPTEDLGIKYFSTSSDKDFKQDQLDNPQNYKYKIVRIFDTRKEALALEIKLHNKFSVGVNESFYNKAKQTSTGWDTTGMICVKYEESSDYFLVPVTDERYINGELKAVLKDTTVSEETRQKMSISRKRLIEENGPYIPTKEQTERSTKKRLENLYKLTEEERKKKYGHQKNRGRKVSDETRQKLSEAGKTRVVSEVTKKKISEANKGERNPRFGIKGYLHPSFGKDVPEEQRRKISEAKKGVPRIKKKCPHCCRMIAAGYSDRWHFDNCKLNPERSGNSIGDFCYIGDCICPHCGHKGKHDKTGTGPSANMTRYHFDNCKKNLCN